MTDHAYRQRGSCGNRIPGLIDPKALTSFLPTNITNLMLWLDFSDISTMFTDAGTTQVTTDGDSIYQINDKSGNGRNVIQTNSLYRPLFKTSIENGHSAGLFDGSNDRMVVPAMGANDYSILAVVRPESVAANHNIISNDASGYSNDLLFGICPETSSFSTAGRFAAIAQMSSTGSRAIVEDSVNASVSTLYLIGVINNYVSSNFSLRKNGSEIDSAAYQTYVASRTWYLGASPNTFRPWNGYIMELCFFNKVLSGGDLASMESYLNSKWAIY